MVKMADIQEYSDAIAAEFKPRQIILFGSHARGDAREHSDVDLMVVMNHRGHPVFKAIEIRQKLDCDFALDLLVRSPAKINQRLRINDFFMKEIVEQGLVLYDAGNQRVARKSRGRLPKQRKGNARKKSSQL